MPDYYQTFYRNYDPTLGRFIGVDPMAEGSESMGVYHYAGDNPVIGNDPGGDMQRPCGSCSGPPSVGNIDPGLGDSGGGGGGIYTDPADAIGRNADPNWMNDGQFDDVGSGIDPKTGKSYGSEGGLSFSSDEGAAGRAFWLPAEMSGGSLDNISPGLRNQIMGGLASLGAAIGGVYSQNLVTTLRSGQLIFGGQTSFVKNGEFYVRGLPNVWVFDDDDDQGGQQYPMGAVGGPVPWHGNFLGPGPDGPKANPYKLIGYNGKILKPIDMIDAAAQRHDYGYWSLKASGITGALFDRDVYPFDLELVHSALVVQQRYADGLNDTITGKPISDEEDTWAEEIVIAFGLLGALKAGSYFH